MKKAPTKQQTKLKNRHTFYFGIEGAPKPIPARARVRAAKKSIDINLTLEHAKQALAAHGQGNSQRCAGAICSKEHPGLFPHPVLFVDWLDTRAYFATKLNSETNLPSECIVYMHHDNVAKLFDTMSGLRKLIKELEKNGPRTIKLYPPTVYAREKGRKRGNPTGERKRVIQVAKRGAPGRITRVGLGLSAPL